MFHVEAQSSASGFGLPHERAPISRTSHARYERFIESIAEWKYIGKRAWSEDKGVSNSF